MSENPAYFRLFNRVSESITLLEELLALPDLPLDATLRAGLLLEDLKDAQREAEEFYLGA